MVHILTIALFPPPKSKQLAELFSSKDKPAYPDFLEKKFSWGSPPVDKKYRTIAIYECPEEKLYQAMLALTKRYSFYAQVDGYTFEILPLMNEADALKIAQGMRKN